jgi:cation-transporting ATPase 13A3/4/5
MPTTTNRTLHPNGSHASFPLNDTLLGTLKYFDYRYNRYALNPRTGTWFMIRDWRDKSWANVVELSNGLDDRVRQQRLTLFGPNLIEIVAKSTTSLLVDEVSHVVLR